MPATVRLDACVEQVRMRLEHLARDEPRPESGRE
jgi:hypothetical protein